MQLSDSKRISLWLLPPDPLRKTLSFIQSDIISKHGNNPATKDLRITTPHLLPTFEPHVTLIGGVPISDCCSPEEVAASIEPRTDVDGIDDDAAQLVLGRLQRAFRSHGGVDCNFVKERGVFAARDAETGIVRWNQSCTAIVERSASFMRAMEIADEALFLTSRATSSHDNRQQLQPIERHFKPPLCEPHYSFVYGNDPELIPDSLECPLLFTSTEMTVLWTYPSSLEGVKHWKTIGRVCMI